MPELWSCAPYFCVKTAIQNGSQNDKGCPSTNSKWRFPAPLTGRPVGNFLNVSVHRSPNLVSQWRVFCRTIVPWNYQICRPASSRDRNGQQTWGPYCTMPSRWATLMTVIGSVRSRKHAKRIQEGAKKMYFTVFNTMITVLLPTLRKMCFSRSIIWNEPKKVKWCLQSLQNVAFSLVNFYRWTRVFPS